MDPQGLWGLVTGPPYGLPKDMWDFPKYAWHYYFGGGRPLSIDPEDMHKFIEGSSNAMGALRGMAGF